MSIIVSPSLLSADFLHLDEQVRMINDSDADWLHLDVMDGVFVPNISFGFPVIEAVKRITTKPLDVHLMIVEPERYVEKTAKAGAWLMNVHAEACRHLDRTIHEIHDAGMKAGVTLCPATPVSAIENVVDDVDLILLMGVNPGFSGQQFIPNTVRKTEQLRKLLDERGSKAIIEVDGGVNASTAPLLVKAGADALVSGNFVFKAEDPNANIQLLKGLKK